jgi:uncharacterized protein YbbC (DUF1343 family)
MPDMRVGLDIFLQREPRTFGRIGWLATGSAVTSTGLIWGPRAALASGFRLVQLFGPEHGPHGAVREGERIEDATDDVTGLPVCSLYSSGQARVEAALEACDTVVVDVVDIGARYSTYIAIATELVEAAARAGVQVVLLDRPNLLGRHREGPGLAPGQQSIVGRLDVPIRHGLTLGEMLRWHAVSAGLDVPVEVVTVQGWQPEQPCSAGTYLPPSPNLNCLAAQYLYPGTCLVEGTQMSEGRGTANPFQQIGAPWLDAEEFTAVLTSQSHPGLAFRAVRFVPSAGKHANTVCAGTFIHVTDPRSVRSVALGVGLLSAVATSASGSAFIRAADSGRRFLDLLWGSPGLTEYLMAGCPAGTVVQVDADERFGDMIEDFLLYD